MSDTPIIKQWKKIKEDYKEGFLFFRLGDFYELFFEDAEKVSRILDITLTKKKSKSSNIPMAGVPYHSSENHIKKLLNLGFKVVICEQTGEALKNQPMERSVSKVLTKGTVTDDIFLNSNKENILLSVFKNEISGFSTITYVDITSGTLYLLSDVQENDLEKEILKIDPSEIISNYNIDSKKIKTINIKKNNKDKNIIYSEILTKLKIAKKHINIEKTSYESAASIYNIYEYLKNNNSKSLGLINNFVEIKTNNYLDLDFNTLESLEILESNKGDDFSSLFSVFAHCSTLMGTRKLKRWLKLPIRDEKEINLRLNIIDLFLNNYEKLEKLKLSLDEIDDIERVLSRVHLRTASPKDILKILNFFKNSPIIIEKLHSFDSELINNKINNVKKDWSDIEGFLKRSIKNEPSTFIRDGGVINSKYNKELDDYRDMISNTSDFIVKFESDLIDSSSLNKIKVCYNKLSGIYIEVPKKEKNNIPENFIVKQSLKNSERYTTKELLDLENKVVNARVKSIELEKELFNDVLSVLSNFIYDIKEELEFLSFIDVMSSLAFSAKDLNLKKPVIGDKFNIKNGRHIVVEKNNKDFTPNDFYMSDIKSFCITGANMAGKSTYMRQNAIISILAHIGSYIPADEKSEIPILDKIITRIGASDNISSGLSTFMVEMTETSEILKKATKNTLVILDEIGRGTGTFDGLSIAWATLEKLTKDIKPYTLFSTHYKELTELKIIQRGIENICFDVNIKDERLSFTHKMKKGVSKKSYGIEVAKLAGFENDVLISAKKKMTSLEEDNKNNKCILSNINFDELTPKMAFDILYNLKEEKNE